MSWIRPIREKDFSGFDLNEEWQSGSWGDSLCKPGNNAGAIAEGQDLCTSAAAGEPNVRINTPKLQALRLARCAALLEPALMWQARIIPERKKNV